MAKAELTIRVADMEEFRLFCWELRMLVNDMRVAASPFAERLEHALDRFTDDLEGKKGDPTTAPGFTAPGFTAPGLTSVLGNAPDFSYARRLVHVRDLEDAANVLDCRGAIDMGGGRCWRCGEAVMRMPAEEPPTVS
jgi:hypothetical protein